MNRYKIKKFIDLKTLEDRGFKYNKQLNRYFLLSRNSENWNKLILEVDENRNVRACGSSIDIEKEIRIIKDLVKIIKEEE